MSRENIKWKRDKLRPFDQAEVDGWVLSAYEMQSGWSVLGPNGEDWRGRANGLDDAKRKAEAAFIQMRGNHDL